MIELSSPELTVTVAPEVGAKIVSFQHKKSGYDFLWRNSNLPLRREDPGSEYDPNFFGGIDELFPNDIPETIAGTDCPDHGVLWTTEFQIIAATNQSAILQAKFPTIPFEMTKTLALEGARLTTETKLRNLDNKPWPFLWKLHAALAIEPGDKISCPAQRFHVADPDWSRRKEDGAWTGEVVPPFDDTTEFLYLSDLTEGRIAWKRDNKFFQVSFDPAIFPYAWYFASYGGFDGHHVAILEPCTSMPISVNEAARLNQCPIIPPGQEIRTTYTYKGTVLES